MTQLAVQRIKENYVVCAINRLVCSLRTNILRSQQSENWIE